MEAAPLEGAPQPGGQAGFFTRYSPDFWPPDFDDSAWQDVIVPHDWAVSFPFSRNNSSGTGYLPGGTAWYRAGFTIPADGGEPGPEQKTFIHFDGVYKNSRVWCNGYYLGHRPSGYSGFCYDISHCVRRDGTVNVIAVKVSHEDIADSRWYTGSGIYRKVFVTRHDPVYVPPESLVVDASRFSEGQAEVVVKGEVLNGASTAAASITLNVGIKSPDGKTYSEKIAIPALAAGERREWQCGITLANPLPWSPDTPRLYEVRVQVEASLANGAQSRYTAGPVRAGIRSITFDPDRGFFLNGAAHKIKGVCVHHDAGCLGAAVWPDVWRRRLLKLKEMGCNAIRASHNPHMSELYDLCDELGFLVMEEAFDEWEGCKNKWSRGHNVYPPVHQGYYEDFPQWHERDLADMVIRGRNHPCIIMWSIGNEIDYPNDPYCHPSFQEMTGNNDHNKPKTEMLHNPAKPNMERLAVVAAKLAGIVKKHDRTRPVLTAAAFPELSSRLGFFDALDIAGYNYKEQFYEVDHRRFPRLPIIGSENGHSLAAWEAVTHNDYISGQFLWTGIDYLGEARLWPVRGSGAGLLDTAGFEKIAYYRRQALWSEKPVLYLAAAPDEGDRMYQPWELFRSWNHTRGAPVRVICYTNLAGVELFCNGKPLGQGKREHGGEYLSWIVPFERGVLEARGKTTAGESIVDALEPALPPARLYPRLWENPAERQDGAACGGAYTIHQIEINLLDENGRPNASGDVRVNVSVAGPGKFLGLENGDLADCDEYAAPRRRTYQGRLIAYILTPNGATEKTTLTFSADGLPPETLVLPGN